MDFGLIELGGNVGLWVITKNGSNVPTAPTSAPTFSVYEPGSDNPLTGGEDVSMTGPVDSETGFYRKSHAATGANGYERNRTYTVKFKWAISGTDYSELGFFTVV